MFIKRFFSKYSLQHFFSDAKNIIIHKKNKKFSTENQKMAI